MVFKGELPDGSEYIGDAKTYEILRRDMVSRMSEAAIEAYYGLNSEDQLTEDEQANNQEDK